MMRPVAAAITREYPLIILHAEPTPELAVWRVSCLRGIAFDKSDVDSRLVTKLIEKHLSRGVSGGGPSADP